MKKKEEKTRFRIKKMESIQRPANKIQILDRAPRLHSRKRGKFLEEAKKHVLTR